MTLPEVKVDRLAFAGDWHMNAFWAREAIKFASEHGVDRILHCGDFGFTFTTNFQKEVEQACEDFNVRVDFVDGNHDNHDWIWHHAKDDQGFHLISKHVRAIPRGHRFKIWNLTFMGLGGAESVDKGWRTPMVDWWPTERVRPSEAQQAVSGEPVDVMIAHDCPSKVPIPGITRQNGLNYFPLKALERADRHRTLCREIVDEVNPQVYVHAH